MTCNSTFGQSIASPSLTKPWTSFDHPLVRNYAGFELKHDEASGEFVNPYLKKISDLIDNDEYDRALKTVRGYLEEVPDDPQGHFLKGLALYLQGEAELARKAFERAVLIDSKLSPARTFLGLISKDAGELREAVQIFDTVLAENEDDQVARLNRGVCMRDLGLPARALYDFDTVIEREPDFSMAYRERGILKAKSQQYEGALEDLNKCIEMDKEDAEVFYYQGLVLQRLQKLEEALKAFETVLELDPSHATAGLRRGRVLSLLGRHETAKQAFDKLEKRGGIPDAGVFKAREQAAMGDSVEALDTLDEVLKKQPENKAAQVERGHIYTSEQHWDEGRQAYENVLKSDPKNLPALLGLGTNSALNRQHKKAQGYFAQAAEIDPNNSQALMGLAASHGILNEHPEAMAAFDRLLAIQPDSVEALLGKAMSAFAIEDIKTAVPLFMRVEELDPNNGQLNLIKHGLERLTAEMEASSITGEPMDDNPLPYNPIQAQMRGAGYGSALPDEYEDVTGPHDDDELDDDINPTRAQILGEDAVEEAEEAERDEEEELDLGSGFDDDEYDASKLKLDEDDGEVDDQETMRQYMERSRQNSAHPLRPEERPQRKK